MVLRCSSRFFPPNRKFHLWEVFEHLCSEYFPSPFSSHDASLAVPSLLGIPNPWAEAQDFDTSHQTHDTRAPDQKAGMLSKEWTPKHFLSKKMKLKCNLSFQLTFSTTMVPSVMHQPQPGPTACPETPRYGFLIAHVLDFTLSQCSPSEWVQWLQGRHRGLDSSHL